MALKSKERLRFYRADRKINARIFIKRLSVNKENRPSEKAVVLFFSVLSVRSVVRLTSKKPRKTRKNTEDTE